jgi:uncharacterized membrane protein YcaP (DUF421 family)
MSSVSTSRGDLRVRPVVPYDGAASPRVHRLGGGDAEEDPVHLWLPDIPIVEKIVRSVVVYVFLLTAFRLVGKRQLGQMTPFDLVVLLVISNVVQNALIGNDNSLGGGLIGATTILAVNALVAWLTFRFKRVRRVVEHTPTILACHGRILRENLASERLSLSEFHAALRREGIVTVRGLRYVLLEQDGHLSVIR